MLLEPVRASVEYASRQAIVKQRAEASYDALHGDHDVGRGTDETALASSFVAV